MSTSPIPTAHLIAWFVKRITGLPWIADFRDPWVETNGSEVYGTFRQRVELWLERQVVAAADHVVVTTSEFGEHLLQKYGEILDGKLTAIYNGYDEDDFVSPQREDAPSSFSITHAGLLNPDYRNPVPFLSAIRNCLDRGSLPVELRVCFVGGGDYVRSEAFAGAVEELGLQEIVEVVDRVPYHDALDLLWGSSVLLLLQGGDDTRTLIPAKAFEYLRTGRSILTLAPSNSATSRLLAEFEGSFVAEADDVSAIERSLDELAMKWREGCRFVDRQNDRLTRYSRRAAAGQLAGVLDAVATSS